MDKLEMVQKVLRFSDRVREWLTGEHGVYFDDFDEENVKDYDRGLAELADLVIEEGLKDNILDEEDVDLLRE